MKLLTPKIVDIFDTAGRTERMMPNIKKPGVPKMFDILEMSYDAKDLGFYDKKHLKLRATSKQIACWEMAIDLLAKIPKIENRRLVWARAMRFNWSALGRQFGLHRVTVQRRYKSVILDLESNLDKLTLDKIDNLI
nr:putative RNA polymerase sigma factor [uncultured Mediterranean phage uvMED]